MAITPKLERFLDKNQVTYTHHVHHAAYTAREVAAAEHVPEHKVAKTIVFHGDNGFGMAVLPADHVVDMSELRAVLGFHRLRLATEKELSELFNDCELGAMPPFGNLYSMPVFLESGLAEEERICFNAGTHRDVVYMRATEYVRLVQPTLVHFARRTTATR